ncbi:hypothetical protein DP43_4556 [Burkholderia pseudomallei]|nr:hypothetical protein DP43_4556 [Burkholderia pseudomallei]
MKRAGNLSAGWVKACEPVRRGDFDRAEVVCTTLRRPILPGNQCFSLMFDRPHHAQARPAGRGARLSGHRKDSAAMGDAPRAYGAAPLKRAGNRRRRAASARDGELPHPAEHGHARAGSNRRAARIDGALLYTRPFGPLAAAAWIHSSGSSAA